MAVDLLGPASALNAVTARPAQAVTYGAIRTWFKNCSSLTSADGTELTNDWLNNILAQLRTAFDGTGIVEDNGDDMLLRAMQSIGIRYGTDIGAVNALAVTFSPPVTVLSANLTLAVVVANTNTLAATINANALGATPIVGNDGNAITQGQMVGGEVAFFQYNAGKFQLLNPVTPKLTANTSFYVNGSTGSDSAYDGTAAVVSGVHGPWATLQHALTAISVFNLNGYNITINVANGTYTGPIGCGPINGNGLISIIGNHASPGSCIVNGSTGSGFTVSGNRYYLDGFQVTGAASGGDPGNGVTVTSGGICGLGAIIFGACPQAHYEAVGGGALSINGPITISGGGTYHALATLASTIVFNTVTPPALTVSTPVTFSSAFISAQNAGISYGPFGSITNPGNVTGAKFAAVSNGIINTFGSGSSYYPGTVAGSTSSGGQYV